jgi:hypothetical protein
MRNLHTYNHSGSELESGASSIGRGNHTQLQAGKLKGAESSIQAHVSDRSFSHESKWSVMLRNLRQGIQFMEKQSSNLHEMESALRLWSDSVRDRDKWVGHACIPETALYLQTILRLSDEKLFNHPLFGSGVEPPIRIHLALRGERITQEINVIPLRNKAGFCALAHSGSGSSPPSPSHFNTCQTEFLNALLQVEQDGDEIKQLIATIHENSLAPLSFTEARTHRSDANSQLPRLFHWASKFFKPWRRAQAY